MAAAAMTVSHWARLALVVLTALLFQVAVLDQIVVLGAHPDVMIVLAGAAGAVCGSSRGAVIGFVLGLAADLVLPTLFGLSVLDFVLVGFGAGLVRSLPGDRDGRSMQVATCLLAAALGTILYAILGDIAGQPGMLERQTIVTTLVVTLGAIVLAVPAIGALRWVVRGADRVAVGRAVPSAGSAAR
jgi:rod shape-determining protein MreD